MLHKAVSFLFFIHGYNPPIFAIIAQVPAYAKTFFIFVQYLPDVTPAPSKIYPRALPRMPAHGRICTMRSASLPGRYALHFRQNPGNSQNAHGLIVPCLTAASTDRPGLSAPCGLSSVVSGPPKWTLRDVPITACFLKLAQALKQLKSKLRYRSGVHVRRSRNSFERKFRKGRTGPAGCLTLGRQGLQKKSVRIFDEFQILDVAEHSGR